MNKALTKTTANQLPLLLPPLTTMTPTPKLDVGSQADEEGGRGKRPSYLLLLLCLRTKYIGQLEKKKDEKVTREK